MITLWEIVWIVAILGLVIAVVVAAFREKSAQAKARKNIAAQNQMMDQQLGNDVGDGFGTPAADGFGGFDAFDENAFK